MRITVTKQLSCREAGKFSRFTRSQGHLKELLGCQFTGACAELNDKIGLNRCSQIRNGVELNGILSGLDSQDNGSKASFHRILQRFPASLVIHARP
ncbi:hypothetical protein D3C86_1880560 [compost metagenome]